MPWLLPKTITPDADQMLKRWLGELSERLSDPAVDRYALVRDELSRHPAMPARTPSWLR